MRADFTLDYNVLTVEHPQKLYLMARFEASQSPSKSVRRPLNLSLVIDRSGSMAGDKIDYTRQAAQFLIQHLSINDIFSIVLYNDKVETLLAPENVSNKDAVAQLLEQIRVRGTTNLSGGWLEGCQNVAKNVSSTYLNRVILMTDGLANRGVTDTDTLVMMAGQKRRENVTTTTMGLGKDFNEDLMIEMANSGGGAFYFIESPEVAPQIFQEELSGLLSVVGQNLTISIETQGDVSALRQLNAYPVDIEDNVTTFRLGDIFAQEVKTLVLELSIPALATIGETQIATLRFDYDEITEQTSQHHSKEFPVTVNVHTQANNVKQNEDVAQSVLLLQAANARREAVSAADKGDYERASSVLRDVANSIDKSQIMSKQLRDEKDALLAEATKMDKGADTYDEYSRKMMATQALYSMTNRHDDTVMLRVRESLRKANKSDKRDTMEHEAQNIGNTHTAIPKKEGVPPSYVKHGNKDIPLDKDIIRIGRSVHNEIVIDEKGISRFHGQIRRIGEKFIYEDLGSTNGSTVDGLSINEPYELSVGDIIYISDEKIIFYGTNK